MFRFSPIDLKSELSGRTRIYEYAEHEYINFLATVLMGYMEGKPHEEAIIDMSCFDLLKLTVVKVCEHEIYQ